MLSIALLTFVLVGEMLEDWKIAGVTPAFRRGEKDGLCEVRPVGLDSIPKNMMEQL